MTTEKSRVSSLMPALAAYARKPFGQSFVTARSGYRLVVRRPGGLCGAPTTPAPRPGTPPRRGRCASPRGQTGRERIHGSADHSTPSGSSADSRAGETREIDAGHRRAAAQPHPRLVPVGAAEVAPARS